MRSTRQLRTPVRQLDHCLAARLLPPASGCNNWCRRAGSSQPAADQPSGGLRGRFCGCSASYNASVNCRATADSFTLQPGLAADCAAERDEHCAEVRPGSSRIYNCLLATAESVSVSHAAALSPDGRRLCHESDVNGGMWEASLRVSGSFR